MPPQSPIGQLNSSMQAGTPEISQVSGGSPNFDPSLVAPQNTPMGDKSPASEIHETPLHRALKRRGISIPPQLQSQTAPTPGMTTLPIQDESAQPGVQVPTSEAELIIKALTKRMDHHSKVTEKLLDSFLPQANTPPAE